ncbi:nitrous oxide reductase accessory protein NosL [Paenirhodobacter sp. CAU 1674]|uniref:nitrous oxide reductase accessory protein NosL n=1 Tax=Paenirhodobacter sp. CAU 1674 TaxID=3032596 RepID=UPI0023DC1F7D|nr:nitrous oxide reductase accessory protein NosL [Paenirhodobacter sp. CAU 1674]MDF2140729.1 nitrous oxide reductase accessory protein NosL [Paenirhodobacter sp. CAU 1674]
MKRRNFLLTTSTGMLFAAAGTAQAQEKMVMPWDWTDENGLARFLKVDPNPLENEFEKYPRCPYCGMVRKMFSQTRHLIVYDDDTVDGTCSLHCAAISLSLNLDRGPKTIYAGDAGAEDEVKPLVDVEQATYVIDPSKPGTMAAVSKYAYADKAKAEAAMVAGAEMTDFNGALVRSYADMAQDTINIRARRAERRARAGN